MKPTPSTWRPPAASCWEYLQGISGAILLPTSDFTYLVISLLIWVLVYPILDITTRSFVGNDLWSDALLAVISFDVLLEAIYELRNNLLDRKIKWFQLFILISILAVVILMLGFSQSVRYWLSFLH